MGRVQDRRGMESSVVAKLGPLATWRGRRLRKLSSGTTSSGRADGHLHRWSAHRTKPQVQAARTHQISAHCEKSLCHGRLRPRVMSPGRSVGRMRNGGRTVLSTLKSYTSRVFAIQYVSMPGYSGSPIALSRCARETYSVCSAGGTSSSFVYFSLGYASVENSPFFQRLKRSYCRVVSAANWEMGKRKVDVVWMVPGPISSSGGINLMSAGRYEG